MSKIIISILVFSLSIFLSPETSAQTTLDEIIGDMELMHEGRPHGVPTGYNWAVYPRKGAVEPPEDWTAAIAWGQLYEWIDGNPAVNTRVQIKDLELYYLSKVDHNWHLLQKSLRVDGAAYVEDFVDDLNKPADKRVESDGSISVTCGDGYNFHFWPVSGRVKIPANEVAGCFVTVKARLILDDPEGIDDRGIAKYVLSVGGDWWLSLTAQWDQWTTNADMGIGRFRFVNSEWKSFNMYSVPKDTLINNPPPFIDVSTFTEDVHETVHDELYMEPNYPNPISSDTQLNFYLPEPGFTKVSVFDINGSLLQTIFEEQADRGPHSIRWNTSRLASGYYILQLENRGHNVNRKCVVIK